MNKHQELRNLEAAERKAWNAMQRGSEADACSVYGSAGKNYKAWCAAADACGVYREAHGLLGMTWRQIERGY